MVLGPWVWWKIPYYLLCRPPWVSLTSRARGPGEPSRVTSSTPAIAMGGPVIILFIPSSQFLPIPAGEGAIGKTMRWSRWSRVKKDPKSSKYKSFCHLLTEQIYPSTFTSVGRPPQTKRARVPQNPSRLPLLSLSLSLLTSVH